MAPSSRNALLAAAIVVFVMAAVGINAKQQQQSDTALAGSYIAGIDVSGMTHDEAVAAATPTVEQLLDRTVQLRHGTQRWDVHATDLGATTDLDDVAADIVGTTATKPLHRVVNSWFVADGPQRDLTVTLDPAATYMWAQDRTEQARTDRIDATITWDGPRSEVATTWHRHGSAAAPAALVDLIVDAFNGPDTTHVTLPVTVTRAEVTAHDLYGTADQLTAVTNDTLDRPLTVTAADHTVDLTGRELGATPRIDTVEHDRIPDTIPLDIDDDAVINAIDDVRATIAYEPVNASVAYSAGQLTLTEHAAGRDLDIEPAVAAVTSAFSDANIEPVSLEPETVTPTVTADRYKQVIVLRQDRRRVYLYENGEAVADWPVAIGASSSPTPTGTFTVGQKRYEPTWYNPARDRWGADMPAVMGPGPNNPLGARALNWQTPAGHDNLIRFHGTPATSSIGTASSNGCVRMFNRDVIDLYGRVDVGATIISTWG